MIYCLCKQKLDTLIFMNVKSMPRKHIFFNFDVGTQKKSLIEAGYFSAQNLSYTDG